MEYLKNAKARIYEAGELIERAISFQKLSTIERDIILSKLADAYEGVLAGRLTENIMPEPGNQQQSKPNKSSALTVSVGDPKPDSHTLEPSTTAVPNVAEPLEELSNAKPSELSESAKQKHVDSVIQENSEPAHGEILSEKFQGKQKFRNDIIAGQTAKVDMSTMLKNKPIGDLAKAIGINDKFLFTKELFDGDSARYSETISHLNSFSDLNDAIIYLQDNFKWPETSEYANKFIDLVRRKFI